MSQHNSQHSQQKTEKSPEQFKPILYNPKDGVIYDLTPIL